ncbi:MAG: TonB-dependent receptor [Thauera sp.]|nr:TonB-dependent receptor [Thauera sp.]
MKIRYSAVALALAAAFPCSSVALASAEKTADAVVVTATRQESKVDELLADVTVVTREEIDKLGDTTLSQVLARTAGVFVTDGGLPGKSASVLIRGTDTGHALLLVDGMPVTSATLGQAPFETISSAEIERIEILRGPASSLYGSEAIGGVVQVFTRRGQGAAKPRVALRYGSHDTRDVQAGISGGSEQLSYAISASRLSTDGITATRGPNTNPDRDGYKNVSASGSLQWRPASGHELGMNFLRSADENHIDGDLNFDNRVDTDILSWSAYTRNRFNDWWISTLRIGRTENGSKDLRPGEISRFDTKSRFVTWQSDFSTDIGSWMVGVERLQHDVESTVNFILDSRTTDSGFLGWTAAFGAHSLQANVRHDDIEHVGAKKTWSAGYGYQFTDSFRAFTSMGTAFKAPSFNDLYYYKCFPVWGVCYSGNPDLKPESARNREIGVAWEGAGQEVRVVYFDNRIADLIDWGDIPENIGKARIRGLTASYVGRADAWQWNVVADFLDPRDEETDNVLRRRARRRLLAGLDYTAGAWTIGGQWTAVGSRYEDSANDESMSGYGMVDLFARYRIDKEWTLEGQVKNVGDKDYILERGRGDTVFTTAGRTAFIGVRYTPR